MKRILILMAGIGVLLATRIVNADCRCVCMNGNVQAVCSSTLDVEPVCSPRVCPITPPSVEPIQRPRVPPRRHYQLRAETGLQRIHTSIRMERGLLLSLLAARLTREWRKNEKRVNTII